MLCRNLASTGRAVGAAQLLHGEEAVWRAGGGQVARRRGRCVESPCLGPAARRRGRCAESPCRTGAFLRKRTESPCLGRRCAESPCGAAAVRRVPPFGAAAAPSPPVGPTLSWANASSPPFLLVKKRDSVRWDRDSVRWDRQEGGLGESIDKNTGTRRDGATGKGDSVRWGHREGGLGATRGPEGGLGADGTRKSGFGRRRRSPDGHAGRAAAAPRKACGGGAHGAVLY